MVVTGIFKKKKEGMLRLYLHSFSLLFILFYYNLRIQRLGRGNRYFTVQLKLPHVFATTDGAFLGPETV